MAKTRRIAIWLIFFSFAALTAPSALLGQDVINGAGSSFAYPLYSKWFAEYERKDPFARFNYQSIGSGAGIRQVTEGTVDFAGTDSPMTDEQVKAFRERRGSMPVHFPTALGAIVPIYNLSGISASLRFTGPILAGIYLGKITKWNDAQLASVNPGIKLPSDDIVVVHRADGSGSTFVWLDYLAKVEPEVKSTIGVGTSVRWPVGLGAKGNEGVAGQVKQTPASIGYVELIYALQNQLRHGAVQNGAGQFIEANLDSVTAAAAGTKMPEDFRISITNASGEQSYPVASFTWLIVPETLDGAKKEHFVRFLRWAVAEGQEFLGPLHYARIPREVVSMEEEAIGRLK